MNWDIAGRAAIGIFVLWVSIGGVIGLKAWHDVRLPGKIILGAFLVAWGVGMILLLATEDDGVWITERP
jgi:hypothetical protein